MKRYWIRHYQNRHWGTTHAKMAYCTPARRGGYLAMQTIYWIEMGAAL